jgi:hypothetical protein
VPVTQQSLVAGQIKDKSSLHRDPGDETLQTELGKTFRKESVAEDISLNEKDKLSLGTKKIKTERFQKKSKFPDSSDSASPLENKRINFKLISITYLHSHSSVVLPLSI